MLFTIIWLIVTALIVIVMSPYILLKCLFRDRSDGALPDAGFIRLASFWVRFLTWFAGIKVEMSGEENIPDGAAMIVGNHQGYFDAIIALCYIKGQKSFIMKKQVMKIPLLKNVAQLLQCIPIDRENKRDSYHGIMIAEEKLKAGTPVLMFPEGTRSHGPEMNEFLHGAFRAAKDCKVPLVPFVIDGSYKTYEEKKAIKSAVVRVEILPPILPESFEGKRTEEISSSVHDIIRNRLIQMQEEDAAQ